MALKPALRLGRMGQPMASRLLAAGHPVVAYDIQGQALSAITNAAHKAVATTTATVIIISPSLSYSQCRPGYCGP